jgi:hypothetical protein
MTTDEDLKARGLPERAWIDNSWDKSPGAPPVICVTRGERGYRPIYTPLSADHLNAKDGVTEAQATAMHIGSMFGWHVPGAYPEAQP